MLYFPKPYPDEIIGSLLIRACRHTGYCYHTLLSKLGSPRHYQESPLLTMVVAALPSQLSVPLHQLLADHTVFPYAAAFLPIAIRSHYASLASSSSEEDILRFNLFLKATTNACKRRFCPMCAESEARRFGETYWHRMHFLPGIRCCPVHPKQMLVSPIRRGYGYLDLRLPEDISDGAKGAPLARNVEETLHKLSLSALAGHLVPPDYNLLACKHGYGSKASMFQSSTLAADVIRTLGADLLDDMGCAVNPKTMHSWPGALLCSPAERFPAQRHLAMLLFFNLAGNR